MPLASFRRERQHVPRSGAIPSFFHSETRAANAAERRLGLAPAGEPLDRALGGVDPPSGCSAKNPREAMTSRSFGAVSSVASSIPADSPTSKGTGPPERRRNGTGAPREARARRSPSQRATVTAQPGSASAAAAQDFGGRGGREVRAGGSRRADERAEGVLELAGVLDEQQGDAARAGSRRRRREVGLLGAPAQGRRLEARRLGPGRRVQQRGDALEGRRRRLRGGPGGRRPRARARPRRRAPRGCRPRQELLVFLGEVAPRACSGPRRRRRSRPPGRAHRGGQDRLRRESRGRVAFACRSARRGRRPTS